jgi:ABC-type phosphate transport system auxiliary subunit
MAIYSILIPLFALTIPIVAIIAKQIVQPWLRLREKQLETEASLIAEKAAQYAAQTERLEQRVRVLERITTDRRIDVADEIEKLRDTPLN